MNNAGLENGIFQTARIALSFPGVYGPFTGKFQLVEVNILKWEEHIEVESWKTVATNYKKLPRVKKAQFFIRGRTGSKRKEKKSGCDRDSGSVNLVP